jgi:ABC-type transport system involved in multi-copper enzyme maturation permease subunit
VIRGGGGAIGASIGIAFALDFATSIGFERLQQRMAFSFMTQLNEIGVYSDGVPFCIAVLVGTLAVALVGAAVVFERNELK